MTHGVPKDPRFCTKCGEHPRRAPDQRWCLECQRVANARSRKKIAKEIKKMRAQWKRYARYE